MNPEHLTILVAVIAAAGGGGGIVAWLKHRAETKLAVQRLRLDEFDSAMGAMKEALAVQDKRLNFQGQQLERQEEQLKALEVARQSDTGYIAVLIAHINAGRPPPPPPRP